MTSICGHCLQPLDRHDPDADWVCLTCEHTYRIPEDRRETERKDPIGFSVHTDGPNATVRRRWAWPMGVIAMILGGAGLLLIGVFSLHTALTPYTLVNLLIGVPFIVGTAVSLYLGAAFLLNTTKIEVWDGTLTVRHGPVPWPGGLHLPLTGIHTLEVERLLTKTLSGKEEHGRQTNVRYRVRARREENGDRIIVSGLPEARPARRIKQVLHQCLSARDG